MDVDRYAMVFAHPGHELAVAGLLQRYRPHLLFVTRADSGGDVERERLALYGLGQLGLTERARFLSISEPDIYRWLLEGELSPFIELRQNLLAWLEDIRPNKLFGDAFELSNVVHDIGRALLDSAWRDYRESFACENLELPLVCRTEPGLWNLRFQQFPYGEFETFQLREEETRLKKSLADWAGTQRTEAAGVKDFFSIEREIFRRVPFNRDYTTPPEGVRLHYDEWNEFQVQCGKHARPIMFAEHFVPIVRELPELS
jgi:hypothetical protein